VGNSRTGPAAAKAVPSRKARDGAQSQIRVNTSGAPFFVLVEAFADAEGGDFADQREWYRLLEGKLDGAFCGGKFSKILGEGAYGGRRGIEADVMPVRGEGDQYPSVGKTQAFPTLDLLWLLARLCECTQTFRAAFFELLLERR
jgi:hypothetical protein